MTDYSTLSDRELDALVAEKVIEWADVHYDGSTDRVRYKWMGLPPDGRTYHSEVPYFSAHISAAFEVVAKLNHFSFGLFHTCAHSSISNGYTAIFVRSVHPPEFHTRDERSYRGFSTSPARAICLAALAVVEEKEEAGKVQSVQSW